ncbi:hypothetical protein VNI00_004984 [Paramarasmius palmivorus]|uniref:Uncharacterized protein n=1 Tax=Paramarasmius palmivorus TaxID=297713 RepID=A0AAW0DI81_9AGAR
MSAEQKLVTAKEFKDKADQAFKAGDIRTALMNYHSVGLQVKCVLWLVILTRGFQALTYLHGLDKSALKQISMASPQAMQRAEGEAMAEKTEVDEMLEKVYANMSACHMKNQNWKRAQETAEKALSKNEKNWKAMFRKAKALGEQGYLEKSEKVFEELKTKNPDGKLHDCSRLVRRTYFDADAQIVDAELARFRAIDKERDRVNKQKLKGTYLSHFNTA